MSKQNNQPKPPARPTGTATNIPGGYPTDGIKGQVPTMENPPPPPPKK